MASGPIRQENSVRGQRESKYEPDAPERPVAPEWLSDVARTEFERLVTHLSNAKVPLKGVDTYALAMACLCIIGVANWATRELSAESVEQALECSKMTAKYQKDSLQWLNILGASPTARARIGLRGTKKTPGAIAKLIAKKQGI